MYRHHPPNIYSRSALLLQIMLLWLFSSTTLIFAGEVEPVALLIGLELKDLEQTDRARFEGYDLVTRPYLPPDSIQQIVEERRPSLIAVRHLSGTYLYDINGKVQCKLRMGDPYREQQQEQAAQRSNLPRAFGQAGHTQNYLAPNVTQPFPGGNISPQLFAQTPPNYSYLWGEDPNRLPQPISTGRKVLKEAAGIAQNHVYPFWFESSLRTSSDVVQDVGGTSASGELLFPTVTFSSTGTGTLSALSSQWLLSLLGLGATSLDAFLEAKELRAQKAKAQQEAWGVPSYYYPQYAETYYGPVPSQPIQNSYTSTPAPPPYYSYPPSYY